MNTCSKKLARLGILLTISLFVQSCATNTNGDFCLVYEPVYSCDDDTEETRVQIDRNNVVYERLCR